MTDKMKNNGKHAQDEGAIPLNDVRTGNPENGDTQYLPEAEVCDIERHQWGRKAEYFLSMVGYCVGLGNIWRFPYICIRNGGGAFLIPFFICLLVCGMPLYFMEVSLGQFTAKSVYHVYHFCPLLKGIGLSINLLSILVCLYYPMILAWALVYLVHSFSDPLPWTQCGQWWNTEACRTTTGGVLAPQAYNGSTATTLNSSLSVTLTKVINKSVSASDEFWHNNILEISPGFSSPGGLVWPVALGLVVATVISGAGVLKGPQSVGKVVYFTATLPYILITVLLVKALTLEGAARGVMFYIKPEWAKLLTIQPWLEACLQVFYSLGPCWGALPTMASFNKFNNNCFRDSLILPLLCEGTSVFAGFAIFSMLGHMSVTLDIPIANFTQSGPGLTFVVYPEALSYLPLPQLWSVIFFLMLVTVALDSLFVFYEITTTTIIDLWPNYMRKREVKLKCCFIGTCCVLSLVFCCKGGMYYFTLVDWYYATVTIFAIGVLESLAIGWIYGAERFREDVELMVGFKPPVIFTILWRFVVPLILSGMLVMTLTSYAPPTIHGYTFSPGEEGLGWVFASVTFLPVPLMAVYQLAILEGGLVQRLRSSCTPPPHWRPADPALHDEYLMKHKAHAQCNNNRERT